MPRKTLIVVLVLTAFSASDLWAYKFEITPFVGYRWGGRMDDGGYDVDNTFEESLEFTSGVNYGLIFDYFVKPQIGIEGFWDRENTELKLVNNGLGTERSLSEATIDYFHVGVIMLPMPPDIRLQALFCFTVGATAIIPDDSSLETEWFTSAAIALGVRYFVTDRIGIRAQTRMVSSVITDSDHLFCKEGGPATDENRCFVLPKDTWLGQIDFSVGFIVAF
jgi:hypothetical protein